MPLRLRPPEVPVSYRLTLHTTEPKQPTRVLSARIDWQQGLFLSGINGVDLTLAHDKVR